MRWKSIDGYEGLYEVSDTGFIKSRRKTLKPSLMDIGYTRVNLRKDGRTETMYIHRVVATAFIPNPEGKAQVNHINGIKTDNRVENLEWCTQSENMLHNFSALGQVGSNRGKFGKDSANSKAVIQMTSDGEFIKQWDTARQTTEMGANYKSVSACCLGKLAHHRGFKWKFAPH